MPESSQRPLQGDEIEPDVGRVFADFDWNDVAWFFESETERLAIPPAQYLLFSGIDADDVLRGILTRLRLQASRPGDPESAHEIGVPIIRPPYPNQLLFEIHWLSHDCCRIWRAPMDDALLLYAAYVFPNWPALTIRHVFPKSTKGHFSERPAVPAGLDLHGRTADVPREDDAPEEACD